MSRREFRFSFELEAAPEAVFPLLCPVREYEWIEHWRCDLLHSDSGIAELDCVFATDFPDAGREIWATTRYEPPRVIEFIKTGAFFTIRYRLAVIAGKGGGSRLDIHQVYTALNPEGARRLAAMEQDAYEQEKQMLCVMLGHYLRTGRMLRHEDAARETA